jgi:hypothetical protein
MEMKFAIEPRGNYTWVRMYDHKLVPLISKWCRETECGKQVNTHTFSFKNEKELTMFNLKWSGQES